MNQLGRVERDFETGEHERAEAALRVVARCWLEREDIVRVASPAERAAHAG